MTEELYDEKYKDMLIKLREKTDEGKAIWNKGLRPYEFQISFKNGKLVLDKFEDQRGNFCFDFDVYNKTGEQIYSSLPIEEGMSLYSILSSLHDIIQRRYYGVDETIEDFTKELDSEKEIGDKSENSVLIYQDSFDELAGWKDYLEGKISKSNEIKPRVGNNCLKKSHKNDPNGGYKIIPQNLRLGFVFTGWIYRPSSQGGGKADRLAIEDKNFNGYGFSLAHDRNKASIEKRTGGRGTPVSEIVSCNLPFDKWFNFEFNASKMGELSLFVYDEYGNTLCSVEATDSEYLLFDRVIIHGGQPYFVDDLKLYSVL